jgi:NADH-quinone oxidoreductase subunit L
MGGLKNKMPITYGTMLIGCLALSGCPPFSGFFSKDEILFSALASGHGGIWLVGVLVAAMTAYYTFRMFFVVFHGEARDQHAYEHAKESPKVMTIPLIILAVGAFAAGYLNVPSIFGGNLQVSHWLAPSLVEHHPHVSVWLEVLAVGTSILAFAGGISIAWKRFGVVKAEEPYYMGLANFAYNKFYVDELYHYLIVMPYKLIGGAISKSIEPLVTDRPVKIVVWLYGVLANAFKVVQVGYVRVYAIYMVIGLSVLSIMISRSLNL